MLIFFDVDGTLTKGPNVWEHIYRSMGIWESKGIPIQESFLNGTISYQEFTRRDAMHFKNTPVEQLIDWAGNIPVRSQTGEVLAKLQTKCKVIFLSTGLTLLTDRLAKAFGVTDVVANELEIIDGVASGHVFVQISADENYRDKGAWVRFFCKKYQVSLKDTIAVGDSAGDIPMFRLVQLPILLIPKDSTTDYEDIKQDVPEIIKTVDLTETCQRILNFVEAKRYSVGWNHHAG